MLSRLERYFHHADNGANGAAPSRDGTQGTSDVLKSASKVKEPATFAPSVIPKIAQVFEHWLRSNPHSIVYFVAPGSKASSKLRRIFPREQHPL